MAALAASQVSAAEQQFLCLVDVRGEVVGAAVVGMELAHECTASLFDLLRAGAGLETEDFVDFFAGHRLAGADGPLALPALPCTGTGTLLLFRPRLDTLAPVGTENPVHVGLQQQPDLVVPQAALAKWFREFVQSARRSADLECHRRSSSINTDESHNRAKTVMAAIREGSDAQSTAPDRQQPSRVDVTSGDPTTGQE